MEPMEQKTHARHIACIGAGYWGKNLVRNFASLGALHTICDLDREALKQCKESYPDAVLETNISEVLQDERIKGVVIATPAETHFKITTQALQAGKDVFVEKPLALQAEEGEKLVALARGKGRILMVGHILEFHPGIQKLKELIKKGELGRISYVYSNRLNLGKFRKEENILWSFAPHDVSVLLMLLGEMPVEVAASGGTYLQQEVADVTVTNLRFAGGVRGHIFVSWLHPYKEQKLVVVGDKAMAVFDDVAPKDKLLLFEHRIDWIDRIPVPRREDAKVIEFPATEPLRAECVEFLESMESRKAPRTDGEEGLRVLRVLHASQESLKHNGRVISLAPPGPAPAYYVHESSIVDKDCVIGEGTKIWHFCHVMGGVEIGKNCSVGQNVFIGKKVTIGDNVRIQNNVSVFEAVVLEDGVFCGPSSTFTNVFNPRSLVSRKEEFRTTLVRQGASIGANATIVCGNTLGRFAFVGAGAVVTQDVPDHALVFGNPAKIKGWMCECGVKLSFAAPSRTEQTQAAQCSACGTHYEKTGDKVYRKG
jgi:UDP-2-acetamido-3-amino-2,3-dideoxy-glucuronate N-acetyltransferase